MGLLFVNFTKETDTCYYKMGNSENSLLAHTHEMKHFTKTTRMEIKALLVSLLFPLQ